MAGVPVSARADHQWGTSRTGTATTGTVGTADLSQNHAPSGCDTTPVIEVMAIHPALGWYRFARGVLQVAVRTLEIRCAQGLQAATRSPVYACGLTSRCKELTTTDRCQRSVAASDVVSCPRIPRIWVLSPPIGEARAQLASRWHGLRV